MRFENLADLIDLGPAKKGDFVQFINLEQFAEDLYMDENGGAKPSNYFISEMHLQGVHPMTEAKHKMWLTRDNNSTKLTELAQDRNGYKGVALEPLRIRTFYISYNKEESNSSQSGSNPEDNSKNGGYEKNDSDNSFMSKSNEKHDMP